MKSKKMKLWLGLTAVGLLTAGVAATLVVTLNKSNNTSNINPMDVQDFDNSELKTNKEHQNIISNAVSRLQSNPLRLNDQGKNTPLSQVNPNNIEQLLENINVIKGNDLQTYIINLQKNNKTNTLKFDIRFVSGLVFQTITNQKVTGFKLVDNDTNTPDNNPINLDEVLVDNEIKKLQNSNMSVNFLGKKITAKKAYYDFKISNILIQQYISNFYVPTNNVQATYDLVGWDLYGNLDIQFFITAGNVTKSHIIKLQGFGLNNGDIVIKAIKEFEQNPMTVNAQGQQTKLSEVTTSNIKNLVNNFPTAKPGYLTVKVAQIEKMAPNKAKIIFIFESGKFMRLANQVVEGFVSDINNIQPSFIPITEQATPDEIDKVVGLKKSEVEANGFNVEQNGLKVSLDRIKTVLNSAQSSNQKINVNYAIGTSADSQKYGLIAHLISLNELGKNSANLNINIFINKNDPHLNENKFDFSSLTNVNIKFVESSNLLINVSQELKKQNISSTQNYLFVDDITTLDTFRINLKNDSIQKVDFVIDNVLPLLNMQEINIVSFGNESTSQFSDELYKYYKNSPYLQFDLDNNKFSNAHTLLKEVTDNYRKGNIDYIKQWLNQDRTRVNYLVSSIISADTSESNLVKTRYLLSSAKMVEDVNNVESNILVENDYDDRFFNPYNVESLNLIQFFKDMSTTSKQTFNQVMKFDSKNLNAITTKATNVNYVHNFNYVAYKDNITDELLHTEINKIIQTYDHLHKTDANDDQFTIWIKLDTKENLALKEMIQKMLPLNIYNTIQFLDNTMPLEYYIANDFLNISNNDNVIHTGFDHLALSLADYDNTSKPNYNILLDKSYLGGGDATLRFGVTTGYNESHVYNKEKLVFFTSNK